MTYAEREVAEFLWAIGGFWAVTAILAVLTLLTAYIQDRSDRDLDDLGSLLGGLCFMSFIASMFMSLPIIGVALMIIIAVGAALLVAYVITTSLYYLAIDILRFFRGVIRARPDRQASPTQHAIQTREAADPSWSARQRGPRSVYPEGGERDR